MQALASVHFSRKAKYLQIREQMDTQVDRVGEHTD